MKILILSTFPPTVCGIGQYAEEQALYFEAQGHEVDRLNISPDLGRDSWAIGFNRKYLQLLNKLKHSDKLYLHYQTSLYLDLTRKSPRLQYLIPRMLLTYIALRFSSKLVVIVHELTFRHFAEFSSRSQWRASALFYWAAPHLVFHTEHERAMFKELFRLNKPTKVLPPNCYYRKRSRLGAEDAREYYRIPKNHRVFLCIGFFHPGKGFREFARLFQRLHDKSLLRHDDHLYIVTSVRLTTDNENAALLNNLIDEFQSSPVVHIENRYVSDEEFDHWIVASDFVVVPYLWGFTSSIAARASLYNKRCILSDVYGLPEQASKGDFVYNSEPELEDIITNRLSASTS